MTDPITLGIASTAVTLVNGTLSILKEARESAKRSDDHDLKDKLSEVLDSVLELKEVVGNLKDENAELRAQLESKAKLTWDGKTRLYYDAEDETPFCPTCFDGNSKRIRLNVVEWDGAKQPWSYKCFVCKNLYYPRANG
jgi:hypothetical protein